MWRKSSIESSQILNVPPYKQPKRFVAAAMPVSFFGNSEIALYIFYIEMQNNIQDFFSACTLFKVDIRQSFISQQLSKLLEHDDEFR